MTYATLDDLIARAGEREILQVADRDNDDVADAEVIAEALEDADNRINASLAVKYTMPLSSVPPIVKTWAVSIARYYLHRDGAPDHVENDFRTALADLRLAADGKLSLPDVAGAEPTNAASGGVTVGGSDPVFAKDKLGGWL